MRRQLFFCFLAWGFCVLRLGAEELTIPTLAELPRIDRSSPRPAKEMLRNSAFILKFSEHQVPGEAYLVLTDHSERPYLKALEKLAVHRGGEIVRVDDLGSLSEDQAAFRKIQEILVERQAKYVAIAPRWESYRENMILGLWELLSTLDPDPQIDVFPGFLLASSAASFQQLIDRSINFRSLAGKTFQPLALSQVSTRKETRSLQKAAVLRNVFSQYGLETPILAVYTPLAKDAPVLEGRRVWNMRTKAAGEFLKGFPTRAAKTLADASLVVMHGHGIPGMSCSVDIDGIPVDSSNQVVLSGSCFAAAPQKSDFPSPSRVPGGYRVSSRQSFVDRYVERGATVAFGHMRLSSGFPHLFPVLEKWIEGRTVGEAYQQLINAIIGMRGFRSGDFIVRDLERARRVPQNTLLYVVLGDPAIVPIAPLSREPAARIKPSS